MRTIAIVNQKGGCGKTTTAINLAALYARRGLRTLLVDMDPQSHCAAGLGVPEASIEYSIGDALVADLAPPHRFDPSRLVWEVAAHLHLAPSTVMLSALEAPGGGLHQLPDKDRRLERLLALMADRYDRCLIDCPPTIGLLTYNALRAAREALIPVETGFFSLRGAEKQWATIQRMINHIGRPIACHLLPTLHKPQSQLACNILAALRRQFAGQILPVVIHEHEALREAASFGQPVIEYARASEACADFEALADWLEEHELRPTVQIEILNAGSDHAPARSQGGPVFSESSCGGRAAELARRVHRLNQKTESIAGVLQLAAEHAERVELGSSATPSASTAGSTMDEVARHLPLGVRQISQGVLFIQSGRASQTMHIVGDFNRWTSGSHPMRWNDAVNMFEAVIPLPPGRHRYRIAVDGEWIVDPHNPQQELNPYGEPNSVVDVT